MNSKGARLAFVLGLILVVVVAGMYFYEKQETPQTSLPASSSTVVDDSSGSSTNKVPANNNSNNSSTTNSNTSEPAATEKAASQQQQVYPAGVTPVQHVTADMKGQKVTVKGYAVKMTSGKGHHFYIFRDIVEPGSVKAVVFKAESDNHNIDAPLQNSLNNGSPVTISGKVDVYKGELEIIVNRASE